MATGSVTSADLNLLVEDVFQRLQPNSIMLIFNILLYGAYTILFGLYAYLQIIHQGRMRYYQVSLLLLYLLATVALIIAIRANDELELDTLAVAFNNAPTPTRDFPSFLTDLDVAVVAVYVTANIIADALLLYRCYIVWGSSKRVVAGSLVLSLVNAVLALFSAVLEKKGASLLLSDVVNTDEGVASSIEFVFFGVNLLTNLVLTGLIAGRLWWISRTTDQLLSGGLNDKRVNRIAVVVLESGLLYPFALVVGIALNARNVSVEVEPLLTIVVGIAPTLILVRTDLGISIENGSNPDNEEVRENPEKNIQTQQVV